MRDHGTNRREFFNELLDQLHVHKGLASAIWTAAQGHLDAVINLLGPGTIATRMTRWAPRPFGLLNPLFFLPAKRSGLAKSRALGLFQFFQLLTQFVVPLSQLLLQILHLLLQSGLLLLQLQHQFHQPLGVPLHENLGGDYRDNRGEVDQAYLDKSGEG